MLTNCLNHRLSQGILLLLQVIALIFTSCEYEPTEVYSRKVTKDVPAPEIQAVNLNLPDDTVFLYADKKINFYFKTNNQAITAIRFLIDDKEKLVVNSNNGVFTLTHWELSEGLHTLELQLITRSGTGSIADLIGAEGYSFSRKWQLLVDRSFYSKTTSDTRNGYLSLSWPKYKASDFKEYVVYRYVNWSTELELLRTQSLSFTDSSYVGEGATYYIKVITHDNDKIWWGHYDIKRDLPVLSMLPNMTNQYLFRWTRSKFYKAIDTTLLFQSVGYGSTYSNIKKTTNSLDTSCMNIHGYFGDYNRLKLRIVPRKGNPVYSTSNNYMFEDSWDNELGYGFNSSRNMVGGIYKSGANEFVYVVNSDSLIRYSVSEKKNVARFGYPPTTCVGSSFSGIMVSKGGTYITAWVSCHERVMFVTPGNFSNYTIRDLKTYSGQMYVPDIPVSDNGVALVNSTLGGFYVYDIRSGSAGRYLPAQYSSPFAEKISSNGDYIFLLDDSLRLVNYQYGQFKKIWKHYRFDTPKYYEFSATHADQLAYWDGTVFSIRRCTDFSVVYSFSLTDQKILNIDYHHDEMLCYSPGHYYVRSLVDGTLKQDVPIHIDPSYWTNKSFLVNHTIVNMNGILYFLNQ